MPDATEERPAQSRRQLDPKLLGAALSLGVVCLLVALTGQPVNAFGIVLPGVRSAASRITLGIVGGLLVIASAAVWWWQTREAKPPATPAMPTTAPRPRLTPRFTGRKQLLAALRRGLRSGQPTVVVGMAGVGKTQLALAYLDRYGKDASLVGWLRADQPATLASDYAALAGELGLPERADPNQAEVIATVRRWLAANGGWLLVFDNIEPTTDIRGYLPDQPSGQVLLTSRDPGWRDYTVVRVGPWPREESHAFLKHGLPAGDAVADELAEALGDLPLALEQALAYLHETGTSLTGYLELLREHAPELLARGRASNYEQTVVTTLTLAVRQAREQARGADELLSLCAFLAPEAIPRDLLYRRRADLPKRLRRVVGDQVAYNDAISALARFSLVTATRRA